MTIEERPASTTDPILSVEAVGKTFPIRGGPPVEALASVSFQVSEGEFFSLVGPSGAGKTTLLKLISGLEPPTHGEIRLRREPVTGPLSDFGMAFQSPVLLPWRSALDNVLLPIEMLDRDRRDYEETARELLAVVGLGGFERMRPHQLSGGMQQRVALCRALIHDPSILLMDEPFAAVDEMTRETLSDHLLRIWGAAQKTVIFVTHSISEAVYLSDRVAVLAPRPGKIIDIVDIGLPRPRNQEMRYQLDFIALVKRVRDELGR